MGGVTNHSHFIILSMKLEDIFTHLTNEFGDNCKLGLDKELVWSDIDLTISFSEDEDGPNLLRPSTHDEKILQRFFKVGERYGVDPSHVLRDVLLRFTDSRRVSRLDNWFYFIASVFAFLPAGASLLITLDTRLLIVPYLLIWGFMYIIYRYGVWRESIAIRLFTLSYAFLFVVAIIVIAISFGVWLFFYDTEMIVTVGLLATILIFCGTTCSGPKNRLFGFHKRRCIRIWNELVDETYLNHVERERSIMEDVASRLVDVAGPLTIASFLMIVTMYMSGFGSSIPLFYAVSWFSVIMILGLGIVTAAMIFHFQRTTAVRGHINSLLTTNIDLQTSIRYVQAEKERTSTLQS